MIVFFTTNSSFVPLIEGLCAQILCGYEISILRSHLVLFFFGRRNMSKKTINWFNISSPLAYVNICALCTHIRTNMCLFSWILYGIYVIICIDMQMYTYIYVYMYTLNSLPGDVARIVPKPLRFPMQPFARLSKADWWICIDIETHIYVYTIHRR